MQFSVWNVIGLLTGSTVLYSAISLLLVKILIEKLKASFQHEYAEKLEGFKNELIKNNNLLSNAQSVLLNNVKTISNRRIEILERIWKNTLEYKKFIPPTMNSVASLIKDSDYNVEKLKEMGKQENNVYSQLCLYYKLNSVANVFGHREIEYLEEVRCFVSEDLYILFREYNTIINRAIFFTCSRIFNNSLTNWKDDIYLMNLLKKVLNKNELNYIIETDYGSMNSMFELLRIKLLTKIKHDLIGTGENIDTIKHLKLIEDQMETEWKSENEKNKFV